MTWRFGEMFNPPGLTNQIGCVQADLDATAIRSLTFPPLGCGDVPVLTLFLDGRIFAAGASPITFTWSPDRVVRETAWRDLHLRSTLVLVPGDTAALLSVEVENRGPERPFDLALGLRSGVTRSTDEWREFMTPEEKAHAVSIEPGLAVFTAAETGAVCAYAASPEPADTGRQRFRWTGRLATGARAAFHVAIAIGDADAPRTARAVAARAGAVAGEARAWWDEQLRALFEPGNPHAPGWLPELHTSNADLARLYANTATGMLAFRRHGPVAPLGRTYDTLMPRYWQTVTFLWDYSLSSVWHALVDPEVMRVQLEHWMATDVHTCFGTDRLEGKPVGDWYAVNDYAMTRMIHDRVRWTGDRSWLDMTVRTSDGGSATVAEMVRTYAASHERFRTPNGLADLGGIGNLLECVSTYVHEVASLNASNVWSMRTAARMLGDGEPAAAADVVAGVMKLYAPGAGTWHARHRDGAMVPVRHCYDFITVLDTIPGDLTAAQRDEMIAFFERELRTPGWMHALSVSDHDAAFDLRPDHQWTGAYTAWPALALAALWREGRGREAASWVAGLARSTNQGPLGQAHFVESIVPPFAGGARKAPPELPYLCDWACSSSGAYTAAIVEGLFGVRADLDGLTAAPRLDAIDPDARLTGLRFAGKIYDVDREGAHEVA